MDEKEEKEKCDRKGVVFFAESKEWARGKEMKRGCHLFIRIGPFFMQ
jgi:hypothetical protein